MNLIAITQRVAIDPETGESRDALDQRWTEFLLACGFQPLIVPNNTAITHSLINTLPIKGVLLTGGGDLAAYGGTTPQRDETESVLLAAGVSMKVPVLGVCRGMQFIQHAFGVKLAKIDNHIATRHIVRIGDFERSVNSYHGYGAIQSVPEIQVMAAAPDGVIESVRHRDHNVEGIMWHPEREMPFDEKDVAYCKSFFDQGDR